MASCENEREALEEQAKPEIATRDEVLEMLTEKARQGFTGAMIALDDELGRLLRDDA